MVLSTFRVPAPLSWLLSSVLALSVGACGGSSGDSAPNDAPAPTESDSPQTGGDNGDNDPPVNGTPAPVIITDETAPELAASMANSAQAMSDAEMFAFVSMSADAQAAVSTPRAAGAPPLPETNKVSMAQIARELLRLTLTKSAEPVYAAPARASTTTRYPCATGGAWTYERIDADDNGRLSAADLSTLTFENCSGELDGTVNGSLRQALTEFDTLFDVDGIVSEVLVWKATYTFTNFSYQREGFAKSASGTFLVDFNDDQNTGMITARFTAPQLQVTQGQRSYIFTGLNTKAVIDRAQAIHSMEINGTITDSVLGTYAVQTPEAVVVPLSDLSVTNFLQGKIVINGQNSTLTAYYLDDGSVLWEIDSNGDGIADNTRVD